jgi:hypothetical protein
LPVQLFDDTDGLRFGWPACIELLLVWPVKRAGHPPDVADVGGTVIAMTEALNQPSPKTASRTCARLSPTNETPAAHRLKSIQPNSPTCGAHRMETLGQAKSSSFWGGKGKGEFGKLIACCLPFGLTFFDPWETDK